MKESDRRNARCLILNATNEPLNLVKVSRALKLVATGRAQLVESRTPPMTYAGGSLPRPLVIRLHKYAHVPYKKRSIPCTPRTVLARDGHICGYQRPPEGNWRGCEGRATTVDHIHPKSKGGKNEWSNTVAACRACNSRKGHKLLSDLGWELKQQPYTPEGPQARLLMYATEPEWAKYFRT